MKLSAKNLLLADRFFWLPHQFAELIFKIFFRPRKNPTNHVFVIKFMGMGSIIRFASLCEQYQVDKSKITLVTFLQHGEVCKMFGFHALLIQPKNPIYLFRDCWNLFSAIRSIRPSYIIDYERCSHAVSTLRLILAWWGGCASISFEPERSVQTKYMCVYPANTITLEKLFTIGIEHMAKTETKIVSRLTEVISNKIVINVNASDFLFARRYPIESFVEIIRTLHRQDSNLEFYLTGSAHEFEYVEKVVTQLPDVPVYNKSGRWTFQALIQHLSSCLCFITCDSGPVHLATYLQIPTIAIWGPTQPHHFGYEQVANLYSLSLSLKCSPCFKHPASVPALTCQGRIDCLKNLSPSLIVNKVLFLRKQATEDRVIHIPPFWSIQAHHSNPQLVEQ